MMNKNRTVTFIFIVLTFFVGAAPVYRQAGFAAARTVSMQYENGLLSASIQSATLKEVFEELKKQTGLTYEMDKEIEGQKVTVEFKDLSLKAGIEKILDLTGLKNLAISYKENVGAGSKPAQYEISRVEIRKRTKAEMEKIEAEEEKTRQEKYQKKEKWYHNLFKDMGKKGKLEGMLKDYAEGKNRIDVETYLRQATFKPEEKPLLREAYFEPKFTEIMSAIEMGLVHAIGDNPDESDKEFLIELLKKKQIGFLMYSMKFIWDDRFIPGLIGIVSDKTLSPLIRSTAAEILGVRKIKEAVPALEEALVSCTDCTNILVALREITGLTYTVDNNGKIHTSTKPPKFTPPIIESIEGR